jgi:hypothetical protein
MENPILDEGGPGAGRIVRWLARLAAGVSIVSGCAPVGDGGAAVERAADASQSARAPADDVWEAFYLQGSKIGYGHTTVERVLERGQEVVRTRSTNELAITRFGQRTAQHVTMETRETPEGRVLGFETRVDFGPAPTVVSGHVEGNVMTISVQTQGQRQTTRLAWSNDIRSFRAIEQSLAQRPMRPGENRSLRMLLPLVNVVADVELAASDREKTDLLGIEATLLRVESVARFPGGELASTLWVDDRGEVFKTSIGGIGQDSFRTTRELAISPANEAKPFDLGFDLVVKVDPPLERPHELREVRYEVELAGADPAKTFAKGPTQSGRSLSKNAAEITVRALRLADQPKVEDSSAKAAAEYTVANSVLQIDDPGVRKMAQQAKGEATAARDVAVALERYVHRVMTKKSFSQAFATAAEVAQSREGDCTEHAVLLAALLRACGTPSRVAIGLVYVEHAGGFGYHMWTEAYVEGQWVPLDGIMGQGGTSAAYLKLADSSLEGASAYSSFLAVAQVLGQLRVRVLEAR